VSIQTIDCPPYSNDQVDQVLMDSFPASDPPPWTLGAMWRRKDTAELNSRDNEPRSASVSPTRRGPAE